ncbi:MAG: DUF559 domain-containing protein, partial [Solirubrobacteraceae bacterium]
GLTRAVNDSRLQGILHVAQLTELLERCPSHPGARRLRAVADPDPGRATRPTRSAFEDRFLAFAAEYGLPAPMVNARVNGYEVDALFVDQRVIVELDGWDFHGGRAAFERDRERDAAALASGHRTLRVTWERLHDEPDREAARLKAILDTQV